MKLILIRHADPDYANDSLTELGHKQGELLGQAMKDKTFDKLYVSPMGRANLTADYITKYTTVKKTQLEWIHELNGNYKDELWAWNYHGSEYYQNNETIDLNNWQNQVPYGEHMDKIANEFYEQFDGLMKEYGYIADGKGYKVAKASDETIVFVCHAGVILTLLSKLLNTPLPLIYSHFEVSPSSRTELTLETQGAYAVWRMSVMNDMSHAEELKRNVQQVGTF